MPLPERQLISQLRRRVRQHNRDVVVGIGDDCSILHVPGGREVLVTTDFSLEGVHFRREWQSPECIGHRCLARGLSDIAAMGGHPVAAFLSLALPADASQKWVDRFFDGLLRLARRHDVELAGGDTAQSPGGVLADIVVIGSVPRGRALRRSGANAGDQIYVTGELGESAAALQLLAAGRVAKRDVFPNPRISIGDWLQGKDIASSAIDLSDGLSTDLSHICEESGVGAVIEVSAVPIHRSARTANSPLDLALHGGEDYELLFTAAKSKRVPARIAGVKITRLGEIVDGKRIYLMRHGKKEKLLPLGWEYFREASTKTDLKNSANISKRAKRRGRDDSLLSSPEYLFVYGTLRRNYTPPEMGGLMESFEWIGTGSVAGRIYDLGDYPGAEFDRASSNEIQGEVYKLPVNGKALEKLDEYEEFWPENPSSSLFIRIAVPVRMKSGKQLHCWAYRLNPESLKKPASRKTKTRTSGAKSRPEAY